MARSKFWMAIVLGALTASLMACGGGSNTPGSTDTEQQDGLADTVDGQDAPETVEGDVPGKDMDHPDGWKPDTNPPDIKDEDGDNYTPPDTTPQPDTKDDVDTQEGVDLIDLDNFTGDVIEPKICDDNSDCNGGYCMELPPGSGKFLCAAPCEQGCPTNWSCKDLYVAGPDAVFVCVPPFDILCRNCTTDQDCLFSGSVCIKEGSASGFCGKSCNPSKADCPTGFECRIVKDDGGTPIAAQCAPKPGSCCGGNKWLNCDDSNECTGDSCVPGTGCTFDPVQDGTPCGTEMPCFTSTCASGDCTSWPIPDDLTFNAVDDDCDGETDEDVYKGLRVDHFTYGSGAATMSGGNFRLMGVMNAPSYHGISAGGGYRVNPGMPLVQ